MSTDLRLRQDVETQLDWDPRFDSQKIGVSVKDGVVALTGQVSSYADWHAAQDAAQSVAGVHVLANELRIMDHPDQSRSDADIAEAAMHVLRNNIHVPLQHLKLIVSGAWITLTGHVPNWFQRDAIETALRPVRGVIGISNKVDIQPIVKVDDIRDRIQAAFHRHASIDASNIRISVTDGEVVLEGTVRSLPERGDAEFAAWNIPGVRHVTDQLTVKPSL
ncbi:MAG TPA: BON domain-containing protein [Steroidobacteraceae bacterium]|jgi:osmotically-inducible protein OsmY|nr:BON domain-containing protein [Steroidobacteraceae bacterium]